MQVMSKEMLQARLSVVSITYVSRITGLAYNTVKNARDGKNMTLDTAEKLTGYFRDIDAVIATME